MKSNQATLGVRSDGWSKKPNESEICFKWKFSALGGSLLCTERTWLNRKRSTQEGKTNTGSSTPKGIPSSACAGGRREWSCTLCPGTAAVRNSRRVLQRGNHARSRAGAQGRSTGSPEQEVPKVPHIPPWLQHSYPSSEAAGAAISFISWDVSVWI